MAGRFKIPLLDLQAQARALSPSLRRAVLSVIRRGDYILGREVSLFETEFARFCGTPHGVGVASGTDALELALRALGIGPGDRVAVPSLTFLATADAVLHVGAVPLFIDVEPETLTLDSEDLERKAGELPPGQRKKLKAVIPVHLYGHPCRMDSLLQVARRHRLKVIEDAAQAAGAKWKGRPVGSIGDAGCFSFFPTKNLGALGDAGLVTTHSSACASRLRSLRVHGRGQGEFQERLGRNSRLDELQAALLRVKLRKLRAWVARRRALAAEYTRRLSQLSGIVCPQEAPGAFHSFGLYVIRSRRREQLRRALTAEGIASRVYYPVPLHKQPLHRASSRDLRLPETDRACNEVLALPLYPELKFSDLHRVCDAIASA